MAWFRHPPMLPFSAHRPPAAPAEAPPAAVPLAWPALWGRILGLALLSAASGIGGRLLPHLITGFALWWLPTGLGVAALWRWGWRVWPGVVLGSLAIFWSEHSSWPFALVYTAGELLGVLACVGLLRRWRGSPRLSRTRDVFVFGAAAVCGIALSVFASFGVDRLLLHPPQPPHYGLVLAGWVSDTLSVLLLTPLLLALEPETWPAIRRRRGEFLWWCGGTLLLAGLLLGPTRLPVSFLTVVPVVWAAIRFGRLGTALAIFILGSCCILGVELNIGAFALPDMRTELVVVSLLLVALLLLGWIVHALQAGQEQTEASLRRNELLLEESQRLAGLCSFILDLHSGEWHSTGPLEELFGIPADFPHTTEGWLSLLHPADRPPVMEYFEREVMGRGADFDRIFRFIRPDTGAIRWVHELGRLEKDPAGRPCRMYGTVQDITAGQEAEQAVRAARDKLTATLEAVPDLLFDVDLDTRIHDYRSPRTEPLVSRPEEFIGRLMRDFLPADAAEVIGEALREAAATGRSLGRQYRTALPAGERWFELSVARKTAAVWEKPRFIMLARDITERKATEQNLRFLSTALEETSNVIVITNPGGTIQWVNPAFTRITGYTAEEARGQNPRLLKSGRTPPECYVEMWRLLLRGESWQGELVNRRKDGTYYTAFITITPMKDRAGTTTHFIGVQQDVTEKKILEERLRQSQKLDSIGQLAGGIAHDFNNLLTAILGTASLLQDMYPGTNAQKKLLLQIQHAGQRAAELTRQLLLFSRQQTPAPQVIDLNSTIGEMGHILERLLGEQVELRLVRAPAPVPVLADAGMMGQILLNLAVNARDAMPGGGHLVVRTEHAPVGPGEAVPLVAPARAYHRRLGAAPTAEPATLFPCLSVTDHGGGMSPAVLDRIFEPFFTTKEVGHGSGLGLATVYGIVQQHHGWIDVYSEPGHGTTFRVFLPRPDQPLPAAPPAAAPADRAGSQETILLVEDEPTVRNIVRVILTQSWYRVIDCASGSAALSVWPLHRHEVRLLLSDIVMPERISGLDLARQLQADRPDLRVILMSGYQTAVHPADLSGDPGMTFISKPFTPDQLLHVVRSQLARPDRSRA